MGHGAHDLPLTSTTYPALELPPLPHHHFWRLRRTRLGTDELQLRKKTLIGSVVKDARAIAFYETDKRSGLRTGVSDPKEVIERTARRMEHEAFFARHRMPLEQPVGVHKIPDNIGIEEFERTFDAQYDQYRQQSN